VPPEPTVIASQTAGAATPPRRPLTPEDLKAEIARLDSALVALVLVFGFLLGSTVARNSDVWQHLATGRLMVSGQHSFGTDPFSYTSTGHPWINHSWLYDLVWYKLWEALGGGESILARGVLVALKALLVSVMAALMLSIRQRGQSFWLPVCCVGLALYAMSPRLLLQPAVISYFLLATTVFLLFRWRESAREAQPSNAGPRYAGLRYLVMIPIVTALWVNVDEWFLLGPLTAALFLVGEVIQFFVSPEERLRARELGALAIAAVATLAACLVSPYTVQGLTLPTDIWALFWARDLQGLPWFQQYFFTGIGREYLTSFSAWAYVVLLGLGVASFVLVRSELRWWRLALWTPFALLSALGMARTIPFFAVVAGPITALNLQDYAVKQFGLVPSVDGRLRNWSLAGRLASLCIGVLLLGLTWPGYLHPSPDDPKRTRHVGWDVEIDQSLADAAKHLHELHQQGVLGPDSHGFNFNPDIANCCAWFCPEEKAFFDYRLQLFPDALKPYVATCTSLSKLTNDPKDAAVWQQVFSDPQRRVDHVIIHHPNRIIALGVMENLWQRPAEWTTLYVSGLAGIFGWDNPLEPVRARTFEGQRFDVGKLAFSKEIPAAERVPEGVDPLEKPNFWAWYLSGPAPRPSAIDQVATLRAFAAETGAILQAAAANWTLTAWLACPLTSAPIGAGALTYSATAWNGVPSRLLLQNVPTAPPGALILAVRSARRAVAQSPGNAEAYFTLAQAYRALWFTQERPWSTAASPLLSSFRRTAIMSAYQTAATLDPDDPQVHRALADMFHEMRYWDLELDSLNEWIRALRIRGFSAPLPGLESNQMSEPPEEYVKRVEQTTQIQRRRDDYELAGANKPPRAKAELAYQRGLVKEAIDVLTTADASQISPDDGMRLVQWKLEIGKGDEVAKEGFPLDGLRQTTLAFASGNYRLAREQLESMARSQEAAAIVRLLQLSRVQLFQGEVNPASAADLVQLVSLQDTVTDLKNLRAILALEQGDTKEAARIFRETLKEEFPVKRAAGGLAPLAGSEAFGTAVLADAESRVRGSQRLKTAATRPVAVKYAKLLEAHGN
jgi:tetratricopeptide (TPR) repeat protein